MQIAFWRWTFGLITAMSATATGAAQGLAGAETSPLPQQIQALVATPAVSRAHWGVMVTAMDGTTIYAMNEAQFFQPASNAKLFTTAAALALLGPASTFETRVIAQGTLIDGILEGDLVLMGDGDPNISSRTIPYTTRGPRTKTARPTPDPLDALASQVAAAGVKKIDGDIIGDDTLFPFEPYAEDWVIDDMVWGYGAPVSALSINDNQLKLTIAPGALLKPAFARASDGPVHASVSLESQTSYYDWANQIVTTEAKSGTAVGIDRPIGSHSLRLFGTIAADAPEQTEEIAIADPAEFAAMALRSCLHSHGVELKGKAVARHKLSEDPTPFREEVDQPMVGIGSRAGPEVSPCLRCKADSLPGKVLASRRSATIAEDVVITNKVSQNLHAELLLHQISIAFSDDPRAGSTAQGARVVRQFLLNAGIDKDDFVFYDGSGLSGHDLVTPRAIAKLLHFASTQPWFADYKASLPIGGVDGSLESRFTKAPLKGHVFAKTGSLGEARALSGYLECASGRTVIFSVLVGNHAPGSSADRDVMDHIVAAIAAAN